MKKSDGSLEKLNQSLPKNKKYCQYLLHDQMYDGENIWLIKPNDFNRGRGVKLFNNLEQLK
jgi:hypothetical protein